MLFIGSPEVHYIEVALGNLHHLRVTQEHGSEIKVAELSLFISYNIIKFGSLPALTKTTQMQVYMLGVALCVKTYALYQDVPIDLPSTPAEMYHATECHLEV